MATDLEGLVDEALDLRRRLVERGAAADARVIEQLVAALAASRPAAVQADEAIPSEREGMTAGEGIQSETAESAGRALGLDPAQLSPLGRRLLVQRARIIASGVPLLTWDALDAQMAEQRDERGAD